MFGNIRKKLNSVISDNFTLPESLKTNPSSTSSSKFELPHNLVASITSISHSSTSTAHSHNDVCVPENINLNAGCDLLERYENDWYEIHLLNEKNADKAIEIDQLIINLKNNSEKVLTDISDFNISLISLPSTITTLNNCLESIQDIEEKCKIVEEKLVDLEDLLEVLDLQERQLDHRFEMAMYKEKKLSELEKVREELAAKHATNVKQYELNLRKMQQERQLAFQDAFQDDLKVFKEKGKLPKVEPRSTVKELSLEDVVLDDQDSNALDDFLKE